MTDTTPQGPTKEQLADIAHKANEQQRAYMGLPPTDEQELRELQDKVAQQMWGDGYLEVVYHELAHPERHSVDVVVKLITDYAEAHKQRWQLEARIDEVEHTVCKDNTFNYQKGSWEGMSKRARLDQLKSQLNNPQEKENINAN